MKLALECDGTQSWDIYIQCISSGTQMQSRDIAQRSKESTHNYCGMDARRPHLICDFKQRPQKDSKCIQTQCGAQNCSKTNTDPATFNEYIDHVWNHAFSSHMKLLVVNWKVLKVLKTSLWEEIMPRQKGSDVFDSWSKAPVPICLWGQKATTPWRDLRQELSQKDLSQGEEVNIKWHEKLGDIKQDTLNIQTH